MRYCRHLGLIEKMKAMSLHEHFHVSLYIYFFPEVVFISLKKNGKVAKIKLKQQVFSQFSPLKILYHLSTCNIFYNVITVIPQKTNSKNVCRHDIFKDMFTGSYCNAYYIKLNSGIC